MRNSRINWIFLWRLPIQNHLKPYITEKKWEIRPNIWPEIPYDLSWWRTPACQKLYVKNLGNITCYSSSSLGPVKNPSKSIRCNCKKICSWLRRPKTILEIRRKATFLKMVNYMFFKDFTNHRNKTNRVVVFSSRPFSNIVKYRDQRWNFPTIWKTRLLETQIEEFGWYLGKFRFTVLLNNHWNTVRTKCLWQIKICYDLFNHIGNYRNMLFQISSRRGNR